MRKRIVKTSSKVKYKSGKTKGIPYIVKETAPAYGNYQVDITDKKKNKTPFSVLSLFSGCGGLDLGFVGGF